MAAWPAPNGRRNILRRSIRRPCVAAVEGKCKLPDGKIVGGSRCCKSCKRYIHIIFGQDTGIEGERVCDPCATAIPGCAVTQKPHDKGETDNAHARDPEDAILEKDWKNKLRTLKAAALTRKEDRRAQSLEKELGIETPDADKIENPKPTSEITSPIPTGSQKDSPKLGSGKARESKSKKVILQPPTPQTKRHHIQSRINRELHRPERAIRPEGFGCTTSAALQLETGNTLETERNENKTHN